MHDVFRMLPGIDVSYKTVERLYSGEEVIMALHNLRVLLLKEGSRQERRCIRRSTIKGAILNLDSLRTKRML